MLGCGILTGPYVRSPKNGNSREEVVTALLGPSGAGREKSARISAVIDEILDGGNLERAEYACATDTKAARPRKLH